jgi:hypothetical protein
MIGGFLFAQRMNGVISTMLVLFYWASRWLPSKCTNDNPLPLEFPQTSARRWPANSNLGRPIVKLGQWASEKLIGDKDT